MPRQARLDAPETLHHVMVRGIERTAVFRDDTDRVDFLARLAALAEQGAWTVYAWAFLPNHAHLLVQTGAVPLATSMRRLLTGYVVNFNRRRHRVGHLFQNRYKSVVVEAESYLLELVRYLHLNPLRAKVVADLRALDRYPWSGHSALVGTVPRPWQATGAILAQFAPTGARARKAYRSFVAAGIPQGRRPAFQGGGLVRSTGGWAAVRALRQHGTPTVADARILGSGNFVDRLLAEAAAREKETLRLARKVIGLTPLAQQVAARTGVTAVELRSGLRTRAVVRARRLVCQAAVKHLGYTGAELARYLGVTTSSVNRLALSPELPDLKKLMNAL